MRLKLPFSGNLLRFIFELWISFSEGSPFRPYQLVRDDRTVSWSRSRTVRYKVISVKVVFEFSTAA